MRAFLSVIELSRIAGVVLLNVLHRLVAQSQRNLRCHWTPIHVLRTDRECAFCTWLVLLAIGFYRHCQKSVDGRHHHLLRIRIPARIADHHGVEVNVRNILLLDRQLEQLSGAFDMDHLVAEQIFAFDTEKHVAIIRRNRDHYRRSLAGAESVFVDHDLETFSPILQISRRIRRYEDIGLRLDRGQQSIAFRIGALATLPRHAIIAFTLRCEIELSRAFAVSFYRLREDVVVLVAAKLQTPRQLRPSASLERKLRRTLSQLTQLFALHFTSTRIDPNFPPVIARDFYGAFGLNRLLVRIERLDVHGDFVLRPVDVSFGLRIDVITLARDAHAIARDDLAARRIDHARLNAILVVLIVILARRVEAQLRFAGRVGLDRLALHQRSLTAAVVVDALLFEIIVIPGVITVRIPVVIKRKLIDNRLDRSIADWTTEVVIGLDLDFNLLAKTKRFLLPRLFRSLHLNFEFRQLVLFEAKELSAADIRLASGIPELNRVFAERQLFAQFERTPCAAKRVQRDFAFSDLRAARIVDFILDHFVGRSCIRAVLRLPCDELPLHRFLWTICRTIGERIDAPTVVLRMWRGIAGGKRLTIVARGSGEEAV